MSIVEEKVQLKKGDFVQIISSDAYNGVVAQISNVVVGELNGEKSEKFHLVGYPAVAFPAGELQLLKVATNAQVGDYVHAEGCKEICPVAQVVVSYMVRTPQGLICCSKVFVASEQERVERVAAIKKRCEELRKTADEAITQLSTQLALLTK